MTVLFREFHSENAIQGIIQGVIQSTEIEEFGIQILDSLDPLSASS